MGNNHDNIALDWVRGEIEQTLKQGQQALEAYVENRDDTARLRFCLNYLHQVHGTLQMVELQGAALLTEEMEALTQSILKQAVSDADQAVDVLMEAILRLPRYLESLESSQDDVPLALLPLLNNLRAARGEPLLSDLSLFRPDLSHASFEPSPKVVRLLEDPKILANVGKLGKMYHRATLGVASGHNLPEHLDNMQKVIQRLVKLCTGTPREELWRAAGGFTETLQSGQNNPGPATQALLEELDHEIGRLVSEPTDILRQSVPETLFRNLLYYVAQSQGTGTPYVRELKDRYGLEQALPGQTADSHPGGPGREAIRSVVNALNEEVARLKDQLDLFVRDKFRQNSDLEELLPGLRQIANTLAIVGLNGPRRIVAEQADLVVELVGRSESVDDGVLLDIAGALLYVEATLSGLEQDRGSARVTGRGDDMADAPGRQELKEANSALLRESRNALEQVKSAVVNFIASQWNTREIEHVPEMLASIEGGLKVIPLTRAADILRACQHYISQVLLEGRRVPDWKQLDTLADTVTSIEYYLERLLDGIGDNESVLRVAEESLQTLGYPPGDESVWGRAEEPDEALDDVASEQTAGPAPKATDTELLDDEILEIFVEEAGEVLETIHTHYPALRQNHEDREALTEVRRAYHTLKGSGRLVGATSIGELAWSIENLLNRVLDQSLKPSDELFTLVDEVNNRLPGLIEEFRTGHATGDVSGLIARAETMATTRKTGAEATTDEDTADADLELDEHAFSSVDLPEAPVADDELFTLPAADSESGLLEGGLDDDSGEPAPTSPPAPLSAEGFDDDELIDDEIIEIFVEEAGEVLGTINEYLPMLLRQYDDRSALAEVRRAFHTLKGSGRMVGATVIGELAWSVENMLNRVIDGSVFMNEDVAALLTDVTALLPELITDFEERRPGVTDTSGLEARANALASGDIPDAREMPAADEEHADALSPDSDDDLVDPVLVDIFESEARTHLAALEQFLEEAGDRSTVAYTDQVSRALHTLKGSANTAGILPIARVITPLEQYVKQARAENRRADHRVLQLVHQACQFLHTGLDQLHADPQEPLPGTEAYLAEIDALTAETLGRQGGLEDRDTDGTGNHLVALFLGDGLDVLLEADQHVSEWAAAPDDTRGIERLAHELEQLTGKARDAGLIDIAELTDSLARVYLLAIEHRHGPDPWLLETASSAHEHLINLMDQVAAGLATQPDHSLQTELLALAEHLEVPTGTGDSDSPGATLEAGESSQQPGPVPADETATDSDIDDELAEIFLEEAQDLINSTADALDAWQSRPDNHELLRLLQRDLHTLKGGARLAGIDAMGDLAHELESLFEGLSEQRLAVTETLSDLLFRCHDRLAGMVDALAAGEQPRPAPDLTGDIRLYMGSANGERPVTDVPGSTEASPDTLAEEAFNAPEPDAETPQSDDADSHDADSNEAPLELGEPADLEWTDDEALPPLADVAEDEDSPSEQADEGTDEPFELALDEAAADTQDLSPDDLDNLTTDDADEESIECELPEPEEKPAAAEPDQLTAGDTTAEPEADDTYDLSHLDPELVTIFLEEAYDLINSTGSALHSWSENPGDSAVAAELQRDVHTLKGGARMAGVDAIADLTHVLEDLFEKVAQGSLAASSEMTDLLFACHDRLAGMVEEVATSRPCPPATGLIAQVRDILTGNAGAAPAPAMAADDEPEAALTAGTGDATDALPDTDTRREDLSEDITGLFLEEGLDLLESIEEALSHWRDDPDQLTGVTRLQQELHTLKGGARLADLDPVADLAEAWSDSLGPLIEGSGNQPLALSLSERADQSLRAMMTELEDGQKPTADSGLIRILREAASHHDDDGRKPTDDTVTAGPETAESPVDVEVLEIFLEEAGEIIDQLEQLLADWKREPESQHFNQEAQRALHTLKGGARLSQLPELGDLAHNFESLLTQLGEQAPDAAAWQAITSFNDQLVAQVQGVRSRFDEAVAQTPPPAADARADSDTSAQAARKPAPRPQKPRKTAEQRRQDSVRAAQETIRVSAPLLDELVNLAGETSITRSRLEQQNSDFSHTLDEMAATIERLREQLRRMDIETEAQILFRAEQEHGPDYGDDFDPLEMDRYSSIQQLSRALSESASDLADLRETMSDRVRDTETLLVQQSRINTELQEGLMKTRMIPFASMVPRLRRIVRQISSELGKKVEFDVRNAEGELDRNILERMIAPLEHMLRNALDHGIETPTDRAAAGKPETGQVTLTLTREGGDVVLRMNDDGAGIPSEVIRRKAIERGLMTTSEDLSEREILQFILQPGFSTAKQVTQISGRGVGMDVVASEIKQLGGSLDIDSTLGQGSTFTVRLPFTVSVNRALMVSTGEDFYAIPLNTIEGIVRVSTWELEEYYQPDAPAYEYAGQEYRLQYLGGLLHSDHRPKLQGQALPLPVILVRGSEQPMALQVDSLLGSREIVVKSLGPQFSSVRGVSGATILGDGNVVVILDLPAMIRSDILSERQRMAELASQQQYREDRPTLVMVVDDSVTVRKVTSRLLERNGMEVVTAKDGLDAVAQLQDHRPDIILLDIEMPRMDGFEVASFVRHDDNLRDIPICMITSRTGAKHRERALGIGVNEYLGKPFQETELLNTIRRLTGGDGEE